MIVAGLYCVNARRMILAVEKPLLFEDDGAENSISLLSFARFATVLCKSSIS